MIDVQQALEFAKTNDSVIFGLRERRKIRCHISSYLRAFIPTATDY
jgi:hypothetical protein